MSEAIPVEQLNVFLEAIQEMNGGSTIDELDRQLRQLVTTVRATGKGGKLNLSLKLEPRGADQVVVTADVVTAEPREEKPKAIFYVGVGGCLLRNHPTQTTLAFDVKQTATTP